MYFSYRYRCFTGRSGSADYVAKAGARMGRFAGNPVVCYMGVSYKKRTSLLLRGIFPYFGTSLLPLYLGVYGTKGSRSLIADGDLCIF